MKKTLMKWTAINSDADELAELLTSAIRVGGLACTGREFTGASELHVRDTDGNELAEMQLVEETLTDGSQVYDVVLRFSNVE